MNVIPTAPFLVVPKVSSERREYAPIGWLEPPAIPSDLVFVLKNATFSDFGLLTSATHMAWLRRIGGRLESRYRYSIGLVYNTFPLPPGFHTNSPSIAKLEPLAQAVLDARTAHPDATLADLYDPDLMPPNLRKAHQALDRAVDRLYPPERVRQRAGAGGVSAGTIREDDGAVGGEGGEEEEAGVDRNCRLSLPMELKRNRKTNRRLPALLQLGTPRQGLDNSTPDDVFYRWKLLNNELGSTIHLNHYSTFLMTTTGTNTIDEGFEALMHLLKEIEASKLDWNEAETRFHIIDRIIKDCLGWPPASVRLEQRTR